jgi:hypothetical protein
LAQAAITTPAAASAASLMKSRRFILQILE